MSQVKQLMIKVCGLRNQEEIFALAEMGIDALGFNFWVSSRRYALPELEQITIRSLENKYPKIQRIGVFVDASIAEINELSDAYALNTVQLHGNETPEQCAELAKKYTVIKAFPVDSAESFAVCDAYTSSCSFFLFDTAGPSPGGNGSSFSWNLLNAYTGSTPFLLAGGISANDVSALLEIRHAHFWGIDLNSRFEIQPGRKDCALIHQFIRELQTSTHASYSN